MFRPHVRPVAVAGAGVFLLRERGHRLLQGRLCEALVPLIDGQRSADEIAEVLEADFPAAEIYYALLKLEQNGYVTESDQQVPHTNASFWSLCELDVRHLEYKLSATKVSIKSLSKNTAKELLTESLTALGVRTSDEGDLTVALVDDYLDPNLETINLAAIATGRPWVLAKPTGSNPWIGPLFSPLKGGCWECLAHRLRAHREPERFLLKGSEVSVPQCDTLLTRQIACNILATEILKWIGSEGQCGVCQNVLSLDTRNWQTETHKLIQRQECPACGAKPYRPEAVAIQLGHSRIKFTADGGYRCNSPEETLQRYVHHVSPITGAVRALFPHPHATSATKVYLAIDSLPIWEGPQTTAILRNHSAGKGITETQAKTSALCEALERYSGVYRGYEPSVLSTFKALGDKAIHPNSCMLYSDEQYRRRAEVNAAGSEYNSIPEPFEETMEIRWSPVWSLSRKEFRFLPTAYCYFGYKESAFCHACSNGNAAGNTLEEAILQGLFELVERDSVGIWWYNSLQRPEVELATFSESYFTELQEHYAQAGRRLWVVDITTDLEIPAFAAISSKLDPRGPLLLGFGCHMDARLAIARALTEMNQMLLTSVSFSATPGISFSGADEEIANWMQTATLANHPHLVSDSASAQRTIDDYRQCRNRDMCKAVLECQATMERCGLEILVLDQTRPDIGLPVVKVIVPGLRHFWARFAPGRLYEVPVRMGWLAEPRAEKELNRIAISL